MLARIQKARGVSFNFKTSLHGWENEGQVLKHKMFQDIVSDCKTSNSFLERRKGRTTDQGLKVNAC